MNQRCPECRRGFHVLEDEQGMHACPWCGYAPEAYDRPPLSTIATDRISPHFGHDVRDLNDEGAWICLTCDPDRYDLDHEERTGAALDEETA